MLSKKQVDLAHNMVGDGFKMKRLDHRGIAELKKENLTVILFPKKQNNG